MTSPITLVLPYPISANRYWRTAVINGHQVTYVSAEAKEYKRQVGLIARAAGIRQPLKGRVHVHLELYPQRPQDWVKRAAKDPDYWDDTVRCLNLDNARKITNDAFNGIIYEDDWQIFGDSGNRMEPDGRARLIAVITPIVKQQVQPTLFEVVN